MSFMRKAIFSHVIKQNPQQEDEETITIKARIFRAYDVPLTFTTTSYVQQFLDEENEEDSRSKENLNYFLMDTIYNNDIIQDALMRLIEYVDEVTCFTSIEYSLSCALEVTMDFLPLDESLIEEAVQASFDLTNNIEFKPASNLAVKSLTRKIYNNNNNKTRSTVENCMVCLEEFQNGTRLVTLPCGHNFDDECIVKWFKTSHICPLCRFALSCEES